MRTMRVVTALWALVCLGLGAAQAQAAGSLVGKVTRPDGSPLAGVAIYLPDQNRHGVTNERGEWAIADVAAGEVAVEFSAGDYKESATVTVAEGATARLEKSFDWQLSFAETITVSSASRRAERIAEAPAAIDVIPTVEIERRAATGQVPKLLEFSPGVEVTQSGLYDYNLNTRGFNSSLNRRVATIIDGRSPAVPFLGAQEWASVSFPMDDLERVEFVRGPSAALYGANASSGVLNLVTKRPRDSQGGLVRLTGGELSTFNADLRWAGHLWGDWYGKATGGVRQSGDFTVSRNGYAEYSVPCGGAVTTDCLPQERVPLDPENDDEIALASARLDRYYGDNSLLSIEGGWADVTGPVFQTGIGRVQLVDVERRWARANFSTPHWTVTGTANTRDAPEQTALSTGFNLALDEEAWRGEVQGNWGFLGDHLRLVAGVTYEDTSIDSADQNRAPRPRRFGKNKNDVKKLRQTLLYEPLDNDSTAVYAQMDWQATDTLKLVLASRYDDSSLHEPQWSPKAALVWSATPEHTFRLTYNQAFQVPNYSEFFLQADVAAPVNLANLPCTPGTELLPGVPCGSSGFFSLEEICALDGVPCGFDVDFRVGELPGTDTTPDTMILALGNEDLQVEEVETWEIGYTGILGNKGYLTIEYYNSKNDNFITDLLPQLGTPLGRINPNFGPLCVPTAGYTLPLCTQPGITDAHNTFIYRTLQQIFGARFPLLTRNFDGTPMVGVASYTNFGQVDTQGVDIGFDWYLTPEWTISATYSWFDFEIQDSAPGLDRLLLPNSPENKYAVSVTYGNPRWDLSAAYRWSDEFRWVVGPFQGQVPAYGTADLVANVRVTNHVELGVNVANVLDEEHWEAFGGDLLGRRALGSVTFRW